MNKRFLTLAVALAAQAAALPAEPARSGEWTGVSRVIAVGDLHGSYTKAVRLFEGAGLLDENLRWVGGEQHLVVAGDFLDRGPGDRELMDLLRRLEVESEAAGGRVHVLLGNHEAMNLKRDLRYVNPISYRAWAADERKADRDAGWRAFSRARVKGYGSSVLSLFQEEYPPGFFARQKSFDADGEHGRWLLELPAIVKINDVAYVHGGLTVESAALGVAGINRRLSEELRKHLEYREVLETRGLVTPVMGYGEIRLVAKALLERRRGVRPEEREAARELLENGESPLLGSTGPLWYRGNSFEDERIERDMLERSLELIGVRSMVVAHSPTPGNRITSRFHGQLYRVDQDILDSEQLQALVVEREEVVVFDTSTKQTTRPIREFPTGSFQQPVASGMTDQQLQGFLARAEITESRDLGRGSTRPRLLVLEMDGETRRGIFKTVSERGDASAGGEVNRYEHEVAAYRLDREIGLNMVPVAVLREIDGQQGSLQSWVEGAVDREAATSYSLKIFEAQTVGEQLARQLIFDALIGNHDRGPDDILCLVEGGRLFLIDHSRAFSTTTGIDGDDTRPIAMDSRLTAALRDLDREALERVVGDLLSERQIEAILARRDQILDRVVVATEDSDSEPRPESEKDAGR